MVRRILIVLAIAAVVCALFVPVRFRGEMDIASGRARSETIILGIRFSGAVVETDASRMYRELVGEPGPPRWRETTDRTVSILGGQGRAHPAHHGSLVHAIALARTLRGPAFTDGARKKAMETYFRIIQEDESYSRAMDYYLDIESLSEEAAPPIGPDRIPGT